MSKFFAGDVVRFNTAGGVYPDLNGMLFDVLRHDPLSSVIIDVTALAQVDGSKYGWTYEMDESKQGWYIDARLLTLVAPVRGYTQVRTTETVKRDTPLPKTALSPQCQQLLSLLEAKGSVTALEAGGVYRIRALPRRIRDLKEAGYSIHTHLDRDVTGQRYARYYLKGRVEMAKAA
jgi:hypothetical protein